MHFTYMFELNYTSLLFSYRSLFLWFHTKHALHMFWCFYDERRLMCSFFMNFTNIKNLCCLQLSATQVFFVVIIKALPQSLFISFIKNIYFYILTDHATGKIIWKCSTMNQLDILTSKRILKRERSTGRNEKRENLRDIVRTKGTDC